MVVHYYQQQQKTIFADNITDIILSKYDYLTDDQKSIARGQIHKHPRYPNDAHTIAHKICTYMESKIKEREEDVY